MTDLLMDMDTLLCTDSHWLLGPWLEAAKALGTNDAVSLVYEPDSNRTKCKGRMCKNEQKMGNNGEGL